MLTALALVGCAQTSSTPTTLQYLAASPTAQQVIPSPTSSISISSPAPAPTLAHTATPRLQCPSEVSNVEFTVPTDNEDLPRSILAYLNKGGRPADLAGHLQCEYGKCIDTQMVDFTGDDIKEVAVAGALVKIESADNPGDLYIFQCADSAYELATSFQIGSIQSVRIIGVDRLLAHPYPQIIVESQPDRLWINNYMVAGWNGSDWQVYFEESVGFPADFVAFDRDGDALKEIALIGRTSASLAGGPSRSEIVYYHWDESKFVEIEYSLLPSSVRIHYLQDAQVALDKGDVALALAYYEIAATDTTLSNWPSSYQSLTGQDDEAGAYQMAFAAFREVVFWLTLGDGSRAEFILENMRTSYVADAPGSEFVKAAELFQQKFSANQNPAQACIAVGFMFQTQFPDIAGQGGHIGDWGVSNISYEANHLCPF